MGRRCDKIFSVVCASPDLVRLGTFSATGRGCAAGKRSSGHGGLAGVWGTEAEHSCLALKAADRKNTSACLPQASAGGSAILADSSTVST